MQLQVLYEDNHLIAVFKPAGILAQPTHKATAWQSRSELSMLDAVKVYLKEKYKKPGNVFVGLLHRLDRPVSGIILFAKTSKGASRISEQFRNNQIEKTYQTIVIGKPEKNKGILVNFLGKDQKLKKAKEYMDGRKVNLYYKLLKSDGKYSLLEIKIDGGKFHQIRAQLSLANMPILGDVKYGVREPLPDKSIALCATGLEFKKTVGDEIVDLSVEIPEEWRKYI